MLIKWFDDNFDQVWPFIENHIIIKDINGKNVCITNEKQIIYYHITKKYCKKKKKIVKTLIYK